MMHKEVNRWVVELWRCQLLAMDLSMQTRELHLQDKQLLQFLRNPVI